MINETIIKAVLKVAKEEQKNNIIKLLFEHFKYDYDFNDFKSSHILNCLVDDSAIVRKENVNIDFIKDNLHLLITNPENYNIKNIKVEYIDNIACLASISFEYIDKINEDRDNVSYSIRSSYIYWSDYQEMLKKVKYYPPVGKLRINSYICKV